MLTAKLPFGDHSDWLPKNPPSLNGINEIELDIESTGLKWWEKDRAIGIAIGLPNGDTQYLPWGHIGGNLSEDTVKDWAKKELRNKHITNHTTKFDIHMFREWGVNLEEQGCTVSDVSHYTALIDDHRKKFSLDILSQDFLGEEKIKGLDKTAMADYHAGNVAAYAEQDVRLVHKLKEFLWPLLDEQDLQQVRQLEDDLIFPVCEMEKNAAPIDVELLNKWVEESEQEYIRTLWKIHRETDIVVNPNSSKDLTKIFNQLKIPLTEFTDRGNPSFTDSTLEKVDHPVITLIQRASRLSSLRSKYLLPYQKAITPDGKLHYHLHQLRTDSGGTVRGRFSSSDKNVQAVLTVKKQIKRYGKEFIVRELYIPASGLFLSADAEQIEYRLFAHYSNSPNLLNEYEKNPKINFHSTVQGMIKPFKSNIDYKLTKDLNFACVEIDTLILKADLSWVPAASLELGDKLIAFDEYLKEDEEVKGRGMARRWCISEVLENGIKEYECVNIELDNGDDIVCTLDHPWVTYLRKRIKGQRNRPVWKRSIDLEVDDRIAQVFEETWEKDDSWESGWVAGFLDGEGSANGAVIQVGQNEGLTWDFARQLIKARGFKTKEYGRFEIRTTTPTSTIFIQGSVLDRMRFLGEIQSQRLIANFVEKLQGRMFQVFDRPRVVSVTRMGLRKVSTLGTSTHTYIAQGYAAHNSIYGAGRDKIAEMLALPRKESDGFIDVYNRLFPEAISLLRKATSVAESRGYVKTILGRRARFPGGKKSYAALNAIIQGTAADIMKQKIIELHLSRKRLGFVPRFPVHDEACGDIPDEEQARLVGELLDKQSFSVKVPILWAVSTGANWGECG